jgi:hypothetical protein
MFLKQSTAVTIKLGPFLDETDGKTAETALTVSQADVRLSKNGGNMAQKNEATSLTHDEIGVYDCPLDVTDTATVGILDVFVHESGALPVFARFYVLEENVFDAWFGASAAAGTDLASVLTDTGTTLQAELDGIQADTEDIQSRLPAALVGGRIDANASAISGDTTAADRLEALMDGIIPGIVGASSTVTSVANCTGFTEATNDHFNGRLITFLTGNLAGQQCQITDYTGSTQSFTVTPLTEAPASSDTFVIH